MKLPPWPFFFANSSRLDAVLRFFVVTLLALAGCAPGAARVLPANYQVAPTVSPHPVPPEFATMMAYVNRVRAAGYDCGAEGRFGAAPPVAWNPQLAEAAGDHNRDMLAGSFFDHVGSDGQTAGARVARRGYDWLGVGENLAYATPGHFTPTSVVEAWLGSPGHCAVIMGVGFQEMGAAKDTSAVEVWTQIFASPKMP